MDACDEAKTADAFCLECIDTLAGSDAGGPVLVAGGSVFLNFGGCIALSDPDGGAACARAVGEETDCEIRACAADCSEGGTASLDDCIGLAFDAGGPCAPYSVASQTACASVAARVSACDEGSGDTFVTAAIRIAALFCGGLGDGGGLPPDAGADASDAGP